MSIDEYINYWDDVVSQWLAGNIVSSERCWFRQEWLRLNPMHMPEPYWGDPDPKKCSIVIANYNPGGGADRNRHTFRDCRFCHESFIHQVMNTSYSEVAMSFPIIQGAEDKTSPDMLCWWKEYGGRKWWLNKIEWLNLFENAIPGYKKDDGLKPFAIEFCGWHSEKWPASACRNIYTDKDKGKDIQIYIEQSFVRPLADAIKKSKAPFGLCVGSQFHHLFEAMNGEKGKQKLSINYLGGTKPEEQLKYKLHMYNIYGAQILVIWGERRSRYPSLKDKDLSNIKKFINKYQKQHKQ